MTGGDREEEEESETEGDRASTPVRQRKTGVDRDGEGERGFRRFSCSPLCFGFFLFMKHRKLQLWVKTSI